MQLLSMSQSDPRYKVMRKHYQQVKRRKRRSAELAQSQKLCEEAYNNARQFWSAYRKHTKCMGNIAPEQWRSAYQDLFGPEVQDVPCFEDRQVGAGDSGDTSLLDMPFTTDEVASAFRRLKRHKAAGVDGIKAEFLLDAEDMLLQPLALTFTQMLEEGVPSTWCAGVIHPIFKAGNVDDPGNYRGITVTSVLAKLFAMTLEGRMSEWAESNNLRAAGQAGFRRDHRTTDNVFIMRTLIAAARKSHDKLYCCFIDFKKAFDSVPRQKLWEVLAARGITGPILQCLRSMYAQDKASVATPEGLTEPFPCTIGVKQGCPASPLLFGLYLDKIEQLLHDAENQIDAPKLLDTLIPILFFADDIALFSTSPQGLQAQLDIMETFCHEHGLTVNVAKTKILVFETQRTPCPSFLFEGQPIDRVDEFKYLGICFHGTQGLTCAIEQLCASARRALFAMYGRCHELHIHDPRLKCKLFDALVQPILTYACEVWSVVGNLSALEKLERIHIGFLKKLLGVHNHASAKLTYAEFGRLPLSHQWLQQSLKYMHRMLHMEDDRLCKVAFMADREKGLGWMHGISSQLRAHGQRGPTARRPLDVHACSKAVKDFVILKHMSPESGNHLQETYFSFKTEFRFEPYIWQAKNAHNRRCIALFRLGCHWLQVHRGRVHYDPSHGGNIPYERRFCPSCPGCIEDERHAIFHCPDYRRQRQQFSDLFMEQQSPNALRSFLVHSPSHRLALFLIACKGARAESNENVDVDLTHELGALDIDSFDSGSDDESS